MTRILLFSADIVPLVDLPCSGGGLRALQLVRTLEVAGHEVLVSSPRHTYLGRRYGDRLDDAQRALSFTDRPQREIAREVAPELVIFASNWATIEPGWWPDCPVVLDLCGLALIEASCAGPMAERAELFRRKVAALSRADHLLCGGERQQWYFRQALVLAGYDLLAPAPVSFVPLGLDPSLIQPREMPSEPRFVYAGGLYPWQDPSLAVEVVLEVLEERGVGELHWFGGSHELGRGDDERFARLAALIDASPRGRRSGYVSYRELCEALRSQSVSLELMARSVERELALTTRTPLCLGLGLPILYGDYAELSEPIQRAEAGWICDWRDRAAVRRCVEQIVADPQELARRGRNAQRLAEERFRWDRIGRGLVDFAAAPRVRAGKACAPARGELGRLTRGERRLIEASRARLLAPLRGLLKRFF